jgi:cell shape-determining protein MreC
MSKVVRFPASIPVSRITSNKSDSHELVLVAIFSGAGLLLSIVAVLLGVQIAWY